ncbi:MAG: cyclase/dehydrase [Pedosphaera sp.]|nr:cyclase/dehydrase [Pedosphaera sp.]
MPTVKTKTKSRAAVTGNPRKKVVRACTIRRSPEELFRFWRRLENLPTFAKHLVAVTQTSDTESRWVAKSPTGHTVEWDALIINEHENELIAWESKPGSEIQIAGTVRFQPAPAGQGTEVVVAFEYVPPGGRIGEIIAKLYGEEPELQVEDDLMRLKALMEAGEIPTTEGQPTGRDQKNVRRCE